MDKHIVFNKNGVTHIADLYAMRSDSIFFVNENHEIKKALLKDIEVIGMSDSYSKLFKNIKTLTMSNGNDLIRIKLKRNTNTYDIIELIEKHGFNIMSTETKGGL